MTLKKNSESFNDRKLRREAANRQSLDEHRTEKHMRNAFRAGFHPDLLAESELDLLGIEDENESWY